MDNKKEDTQENTQEDKKVDTKEDKKEEKTEEFDEFNPPADIGPIDNIPPRSKRAEKAPQSAKAPQALKTVKAPQTLKATKAPQTKKAERAPITPMSSVTPDSSALPETPKEVETEKLSKSEIVPELEATNLEPKGAEIKIESVGTEIKIEVAQTEIKPTEFTQIEIKPVEIKPTEVTQTEITTFDQKMSAETLKVKLLTSTARPPERKSEGAAGYDVFSDEDKTVARSERSLISTGFIIAIPLGYYGRLAPRSGLAVQNSIDIGGGVIDSDYRGEVKVCFVNNGKTSYDIKKGDRIAQLIIEKISTSEVEVVENLDSTERGTKGFGSTGK